MTGVYLAKCTDAQGKQTYVPFDVLGNGRSRYVAVTADIPLAAVLVPKGVIVIDPRGEEYTPEIIGERLSVRDFMTSLRSTGVETGGHAPYGAREKQAFANALDRVLTRARRAEMP